MRSGPSVSTSVTVFKWLALRRRTGCSSDIGRFPIVKLKPRWSSRKHGSVISDVRSTFSMLLSGNRLSDDVRVANRSGSSVLRTLLAMLLAAASLTAQAPQLGLIAPLPAPAPASTFD